MPDVGSNEKPAAESILAVVAVELAANAVSFLQRCAAVNRQVIQVVFGLLVNHGQSDYQVNHLKARGILVNNRSSYDVYVRLITTAAPVLLAINDLI